MISDQVGTVIGPPFFSGKGLVTVFKISNMTIVLDGFSERSRLTQVLKERTELLSLHIVRIGISFLQIQQADCPFIHKHNDTIHCVAIYPHIGKLHGLFTDPGQFNIVEVVRFPSRHRNLL